MSSILITESIKAGAQMGAALLHRKSCTGLLEATPELHNYVKPKVHNSSAESHKSVLLTQHGWWDPSSPDTTQARADF